jgi:hypothetical protein
MAIATPLSRTLVLQFQVGTTTAGVPKLLARRYPKVSPGAVDEDVLAVGQALAALFAEPLFLLDRLDDTGISA